MNDYWSIFFGICKVIGVLIAIIIWGFFWAGSIALGVEGLEENSPIAKMYGVFFILIGILIFTFGLTTGIYFLK